MGDHNQSNQVVCPICSKVVEPDLINLHLDTHLDPDPPKTFATSPSLFQPTLSFQRGQSLKRQHPTSSPEHPQSQKKTGSISASTSQRQEKTSAPLNPAGSSSAPLAERVRPKTIEQFLGQPHLQRTGAGLAVTSSLLASGASFILWGPPGSGKTTLARCLAASVSPDCQFREISGTEFGASDWKKLVNEALGLQKLIKRKTLVFIDEAQRLNKAQQDCKLITLYAHQSEDILAIIKRAVELEHAQVDPTLIKWLSEAAEGDARVALTNLELIIQTQKTNPNLGVNDLKQVLGKRYMLYDRDGDNHYDLISALHKSIRGGDADAGLYWLARMLESGEDPLYVARRLVRMASEDIGLANPAAITQAVSAYQATQLIGMPECDCILAQVVVMLAESPKSVRVYKAYGRAKAAVGANPAYPVPLHIRNAPTKMMKDLGYGAEYKYEPGYAHPVYQTFLPPELNSSLPFLKKEGNAAGETAEGKIFDPALLEEWEIKKNDGQPWPGKDSDQE